MAVRRVFAIWTHPIFYESVRRLLNHPDVEWVGAASSYAAAKEQIAGLKPDTILVEEVSSADRDEVMRILEASPWKLRVIGLNLADNELSVYRREQRTVARGEDLLKLVLSDPSRGGRE